MERQTAQVLTLLQFLPPFCLAANGSQMCCGAGWSGAERDGGWLWVHVRGRCDELRDVGQLGAACGVSGKVPSEVVRQGSGHSRFCSHTTFSSRLRAIAAPLLFVFPFTPHPPCYEHTPYMHGSEATMNA